MEEDSKNMWTQRVTIQRGELRPWSLYTWNYGRVRSNAICHYTRLGAFLCLIVSP